MKGLDTPSHSGPAEMPEHSRFLSDAEYRLVQNNIVIACADVLIVDPQTGEALSGFRQQKPQEGYWFSCGGRMKRGQSYQEAGAVKLREELGLEIDPRRLELLTAYSTAFAERAQEPSDEGVHTSNAALVLFVSPEERDVMRVEFNEEHEKADWFSLGKILERDEEFPPILQDAVEKVRSHLVSQFTYESLSKFFVDARKIRKNSYTSEVKGMPRTERILKHGEVFFMTTTGGRYSDNEPFRSYIRSFSQGDKIFPVKNNQPDTYRSVEGTFLQLGQASEVTTRLLGVPVQTCLYNHEGEPVSIVGYKLPEEIIEQAEELVGWLGSDIIPPSEEVSEAGLELQYKIRRILREDENYLDERLPKSLRSKS